MNYLETLSDQHDVLTGLANSYFMLSQALKKGEISSWVVYAKLHRECLLKCIKIDILYQEELNAAEIPFAA